MCKDPGAPVDGGYGSYVQLSFRPEARFGALMKRVVECCRLITKPRTLISVASCSPSAAEGIEHN